MINIVPQLTVWVDVYDDKGDLIVEYQDETISYSETVNLDMKDKYKQLIGDGNARINTSLSAKIGGANFSSISVGASCTLGADQSEGKMALAQKYSHEICQEFVFETLLESAHLLDRVRAEIDGE